MLDTIILQLENGKFQINDFSKFGTTKEEVLYTRVPFKKWVYNPKRQNDNYLPRLTLIKRGARLYLKIEFSATKLILNNNVDELDDKELGEVPKTLQKKMLEIGVIVWMKDLEEAQVLSFHPAKNIPLKNGFTANLAIKELHKVDISKRFDLDEKGYRNNGEVLQVYTRSHSFVIYDKISDLNKPKKRAMDTDQTNKQKTIFDFIKTDCKRFEILRIEVRLSLKRKMDIFLKKIGYKPNPTFKDILDKRLCQKILTQYWEDFFGDNQFVFSINSNPQDVLQLIFRRHPKIRVIKAINIVGLYMLCRNDEGIRGFRQIVDDYKPKTNWITVKKYLKVLEDEIFTNATWGFIKDIKEELFKFNSFKVQRYGQTK